MKPPSAIALDCYRAETAPASYRIRINGIANKLTRARAFFDQVETPDRSKRATKQRVRVFSRFHETGKYSRAFSDQVETPDRSERATKQRLRAFSRFTETGERPRAALKPWGAQSISRHQLPYQYIAQITETELGG